MIPAWLQTLATISLTASAICAAVIATDIAAGHRQKMWIMNVVWPITALYSGPLALFAYFKTSRMQSEKPFWAKVALAATHCGAGCTLGDIVAEWIVFAAPLVIFGEKLFGSWVLDFVCAYLFGIVFQYFTIKPMRDLSPSQGIWAAIKADTLSLTSWQIGMYGFMAIAVFVIFGHELPKTGPVFWFMMQIAMLTGFITSYPVNWLLLRIGWKEAM